MGRFEDGLGNGWAGCRALPRETAVAIIATQLLRSGTSTSSNYRAARRGRSRAEFIAKRGVVVEEVDETMHWLEMIVAADLLSDRKALDELQWLLREAGELRAIFVRSVSTARLRIAPSPLPRTLRTAL